MSIFAVILIMLLSWDLGAWNIKRKVMAGRVEIDGRRYECRDAGPADK